MKAWQSILAFIVIPLVTATIIPWGARPQALTSAVGVSVTLWSPRFTVEARRRNSS